MEFDTAIKVAILISIVVDSRYVLKIHIESPIENTFSSTVIKNKGAGETATGTNDINTVNSVKLCSIKTENTCR